MALTGTLKKPSAEDWACPGGLKQKTQIQICYFIDYRCLLNCLKI